MSYKTNYCVYKITNTITNECYIGVDTYFPKRIGQHKSNLKKNQHKNKHLQYSYNKYGEDNFSFELFYECKNREEMLSKEIEFINLFNSNREGFNKTFGGEGSFGFQHSQESLRKMSSWKRVMTDEWKQNISKATKGKKKKEGIKRNNHPDYSRWLGGENHPVSKLSSIDVLNIRLKYLNEEKQTNIAKEFNLSKTMINNIITNRNWFDEDYFYIKKVNFNSEDYIKLREKLYEKVQIDT